MTSGLWDSVRGIHFSPDSASQAMVDALLDLDERQAGTAVQVLDLQNEASNKAKFDVRLEALKAAREHIAALESEHANSRGYRDRAMTAAERIAQELKVARYLLMEDEC